MSDKNIVKSSIVVTVLMLIFKVFGFVKQAVIAYYFGATIATDSYFIAWGFIFGVSESIVKSLSISLVPIYTTVLLTNGKEKAAKLINSLIQVLIPIFIIIVVIIYVLSPVIAHVLAPSYVSDSRELLINYIRVLAPIILFSSSEFVMSAVLDSHKSFYVPRMQSFIYSVSIIACSILLSGKLGVKALILGQYITKVIFFVLLVYYVREYHKFFIVKICEIDGIKKIFYTAIPLFIGNSVFYINNMVDNAISSGLGNGAASVLSYCQIIEQFVSSIIITNVGGILFVSFAEQVAKKENDKVVDSLYESINVMTVILTAITVIAAICSRDIVSIVYLRGNFSYEAMLLASTVLVGYVISFVPMTIRDFAAKGLYAFQDTYKTMISSIICISVNIILSISLSKILGLLGVTLATSIARMLGMVININFLKQELPSYRFSKHVKVLMKCVPGALGLSAIAFVVEKMQLWNPFIRFTFITIFGGMIYLLIGRLCHVYEIEKIIGIIKKKIIKNSSGD